MDGLLSKKFLSDIGVDLDEEMYQVLSKHYEDTLNERVVEEVVDELDEDKLQELNTIKDSSIEQLQNWLLVNVPMLDEIIEDEIAILLGEIAEGTERI